MRVSTIKEQWLHFSKTVHTDAVSPTQYAETKKAFYAGYFMALMVSKTEIAGIEDEDQALIELQNLHNEAEKFFRGFLDELN